MTARSVVERRPRAEVVARFNAGFTEHEAHVFVMVAGPPSMPVGYTEVVFVDRKRGSRQTTRKGSVS